MFCVGERTLKSTAPRMWYVALSRCGATGPIAIHYEFNITGYYGDCEEDPLSRTLYPPQEMAGDSSVHLAIGLGVLAGIAIIVAVVFIVLFIVNRRKMTQKPKTSGSVTSSQATMTQDIFYVNPSLSDRGEHSDSQYSRSSSENYYEVIPDRRSYESINTQLALHGHGGRAFNLAAIQRGEHRAPRIPSYIFEDIPPPPYQPPNLQAQGQGHQHQNSGSSGHQSQGSGSGHPLLGTQSPYSGGGLQHLSLQTRFVPISSSGQGPVTMATTTTRMPLHSNPNGPMSPNSNGGNNIAMQTTLHSSTGNFHTSGASSSGQCETSMGGINSLAGGLNSRENALAPRSQINDVTSPMTSQNGGPIQNGTLGRYPHHAKLLNQNYRIQQFETTA